MADFYGKAAATALKLIKKRGQTGKLVHLESGVYDPVAGQEAEKTETEYPVTFAAFSYTDKERSDSRHEKGALIQAGDKKILMAAENAKPKPGDLLVIGGYGTIDEWPLLSEMGPIGYDGGQPWEVISVKTLNPGGVDVLYTLQVRR